MQTFVLPYDATVVHISNASEAETLLGIETPLTSRGVELKPNQLIVDTQNYQKGTCFSAISETHQDFAVQIVFFETTARERQTQFVMLRGGLQ